MEYFIVSAGEIAAAFQLGVAMVLGLLLGVERSIAGKEAGMRTFALVTVGSCLFIIASELVGERLTNPSDFDPVRVASTIVSGIGFLGGGLIIFNKELRGLTTAAGLWVAAGIGIAVGFKLYFIAVFATFLTLFVFLILWYLEQFIESHIELPEIKKKVQLIKNENEQQIAQDIL